ncbi:MAG: aspartate aminotransferase [Thermovirga sp.]|jgi:aspartate aminotransferase|nr:aspartate aminotransferase [Thermovirga sp.]
MKLSQRALRMEPSATLAVVGKAKKLKAEGKPVISFGAGEPDFNSPAAALAYAKEAMERGETHYTIATGIPKLKELVVDYYKNRFNIETKPEQVIIGAGAKPLIYEALACLLDPGDEVLVFSPAWVSYVEQIRLCEGKEVIVETSDTDFIPSIERVKQAITDKTVGMIINTPNNPTGAVYDKKTLAELAELAKEKDLWIIYDEIYERLVYENETHHCILSLVPEIEDRTILINGVSKAFAMTGWRIGYGIAPTWLAPKMGAFQGHLTSNPCSIAQWAAVGALEKAEDDVVKMHKAFSERRKLIVELLSTMPHISFTAPKGAFYVFVNIKGTLGKKHDNDLIDTDITFCTQLLEKKYVAAVPGTAFLAPGHIRLGYANSAEEITEGMNRLKSFLEEIK